MGDGPVTLDNLRLLASRESVEEPSQFYIKSFSQGGQQVSERCISNFRHPYPSLKGLQKEIIRCAGGAAGPPAFARCAAGASWRSGRSAAAAVRCSCTLPWRRYKRDDGLELNGTLYLPPGYDAQRDGPLPCLLWAYPRVRRQRLTFLCEQLGGSQGAARGCLGSRRSSQPAGQLR